MKNILTLTISALATLIFLISFPLLISKITNEPLYVQNSFVPYLEDFKKDADKYKIKLDFYRMVTIFSDREELGVAAFCVPSTKMIVIYSKVWRTLDASSRKAPLYHEWGHCILRRDHVEDINYSQLCPTSLMYPYIEPLKSCYGKYQESYNKELFTNPFNFKTFSRSRK